MISICRSLEDLESLASFSNVEIVTAERDDGFRGQYQSPNNYTLMVERGWKLSKIQKSEVERWMAERRSFILLNSGEADRFEVLAHELGHHLVYLAALDMDFTRPSRELRKLARRQKFEPGELDSTDELRAEIVAREITGKPLYPKLELVAEEILDRANQALTKV
jgi:hypothetical protein